MLSPKSEINYFNFLSINKSTCKYNKKKYEEPFLWGVRKAQKHFTPTSMNAIMYEWKYETRKHELKRIIHEKILLLYQVQNSTSYECVWRSTENHFNSSNIIENCHSHTHIINAERTTSRKSLNCKMSNSHGDHVMSVWLKSISWYQRWFPKAECVQQVYSHFTSNSIRFTHNFYEYTHTKHRLKSTSIYWNSKI